MLLFLGVAALGATLAIAWAADDPATERVVATTEVGTDLTTQPTEVPTIGETVPPPPPTAPGTTPPATTAQTVTTPTVPEQPPPGALVQWPASRNGYTVVLVSLPTSGGRARAVQTARRASRAGLQEVGVIESGSFSSLHPGYYVVFAGIYDNQGEAQSAVPAARSAGFGGAYPRQIAR